VCILSPLGSILILDAKSKKRKALLEELERKKQRLQNDAGALVKEADDAEALVKEADDAEALVKEADDAEALVKEADDAEALVQEADDESLRIRLF